VNDLPASLVFNLDETGHQEWANCSEQKVIVPAVHPGDVIDIPSNQATILVCVVADGTALKPMMNVQRSTSESELFEVGYTHEQLLLAYRESDFIDRHLLIEWANEIFAPEVMKRGKKLNYQGPEVLLLDGCSSHYPDDFFAICVDGGVLPVFLPPHSSKQIQALDVGRFGIHERGIVHGFPPDWLSPQSKQI
jgi:hypothetical protein